jgi:hypothetical protein
MMLHLTHCQCSACLSFRLADDAPLGSLPLLDWLGASAAATFSVSRHSAAPGVSNNSLSDVLTSCCVTQVIIEKVGFFFFFFSLLSQY